MGRHLEGDSILWGILGDTKIYVNGTIHNLNFLKKLIEILISKLAAGKNFFSIVSLTWGELPKFSRKRGFPQYPPPGRILIFYKHHLYCNSCKKE